MVFNKEEWLKSVKHTIHEDGSISVDGDVNLYRSGLTEIPFNFRHVSGNFYCNYNQLTSLKGSPTNVEGFFNCAENKLTSLEGSPTNVGGDFTCRDNQLTS